ncbi:MAG: metallophosphoesterase, partial [Flavobacteriaceae bacterium]|nr:metallophosphoesterase [Flavobacteriaceae bacterium]
IFYFRETINSTEISNLLRGFFFSFLIFKLLIIIFLFLNDIERILHLTYSFLVKIFFDKKKVVETKSRRKFVTQLGLLIAAIPFSSLIYGITLGKYNFKVIKHALKFKTLPKAFNKFKIVHISDIHAGSFDDLESVQEGVDLIQAQQPDIILFSGDLVNNDSREIEPYISMFKSLKAPFGKFAVLGNHDYGDYKQWNSIDEKEENLKKLFHYFDEMGFKLLNNSNKIISKENESIAIIGVENWGRPPFPQKGDLKKALQNTAEHFKILLSHDPTHWDLEVKNHPTNIDLTLSGHTHGMQFGVEIPGVKWSPVKYIYPHWAGLYQFDQKYLNVNRGFGFLGYPGRVGIWPEITVIELNS